MQEKKEYIYEWESLSLHLSSVRPRTTVHFLQQQQKLKNSVLIVTLALLPHFFKHLNPTLYFDYRHLELEPAALQNAFYIFTILTYGSIAFP